MKAKGESELRVMALPDAAAYYADGNRSIVEIADSIAVEYAHMAIDALELVFRAFEKAGIMRIIEKQGDREDRFQADLRLLSPRRRGRRRPLKGRIIL